MERRVDLSRFGRFVFLYRTLEGEEVGRGEKKNRRWEALDTGEWSDQVNTGIRIARNQAVKDILQLPIAAPEAAQ